MADTLDNRLAGGLGLEPRLTESESFGNYPKLSGNPGILRITAQKIEKVCTAVGGYFRHNFVTACNALISLHQCNVIISKLFDQMALPARMGEYCNIRVTSGHQNQRATNGGV